MSTIFDAWATDPRYQQLVSSPGFLAATPLFKNQIHDILFKYGLAPSADQQALYGGTVEDNPYSVAAMLKRDYGNANVNTATNLAARGALESGAAAAAMNANSESYKKGIADSRQAMGQEINSALGSYNQTIGDLFNTLEQNPTVPPAPGSQAAPPPPGTSIGNGLPVPQGPYVRTGPETPSPTYTRLKPKKIVTGPQNVGLPGYR